MGWRSVRFGAKAPNISPVNEGEIEWIARQVSLAATLVERYAPTQQNSPPGTDQKPIATNSFGQGHAHPLPTLEDIDRLCSTWAADKNSQLDTNALINAVGVVFGEHLTAQADLRWVIATDKQGTELAVFNETRGITLYPQNLVAKRVVSREIPFAVELFDATTKEITQIRAR